MNKTFRVPFENDKGENYWHDLPTREEAEERRTISRRLRNRRN